MDLELADTLGFWAIAASMTVGALAFVLLPLSARRARGSGATAAAVNVDAYRSQLAELERDFASGAMPEGDYRQARRDLELRLLADADEQPASASTGAPRVRGTKAAAIAVGVALPALAFGLYALFGAPAALREAAPVANPFAVAAGDTPATLRAKLVAHVERTPRDGRAWMLLARLDFAADRYADAAASYAQAVAVSKQVARDPVAWCEYADALGAAQGGSLAGKPRELIAHALTLDATNPKALEMAGSAAFEQGDPAAAAGYWRQLLAQLPPRSPERRELAAAVARAEELAAAGTHVKAGSQ
jgi:cytochrome c-type biogenesis protein CcmH